MPGNHVDLNRQFQEASTDEDRPFRGLFGTDSGRLVWKDLLDKPRVVVLAEAGSGKSSEFGRQREQLVADGKFAFGASVALVARSGLPGALVPSDRKKLDEWKNSPDALCWLFIDSVDEAKDQGQRFEEAARQLADAIAGREERVRLIISSRFTDWDATADRETMAKWLRMPPPPPEPAPALEDEVRATLQNRSRAEKPAPAEPILVVRMVELDHTRIKLFAEGMRISDADRLLAAIDHGDLWRFAARPLDLTWIVEFWRSRERLGTLREMIEESVAARLIDPDVHRRRKDPLDPGRSGLALDRIGAGFVFCGKDSLRLPAAGIDFTTSDKSIPIESLLPDWPDSDRLLLLGRPVFDPATLGRARLHNDNEGTLRCYLTARWLNRLLANNCPLQVIKDLLFADLYGYRLVRPDMVETAAWLAGFNTAVAEELIARSPFTLISCGDPGSLPIPTRIKAFTAVLGQVAEMDKQKLWFIDRSLRRFADPALDAHVAEWWALAAANTDTESQHLLLRLIRCGKLPAGLTIARSIAVDMGAEEITQLLACRVLIEIGNADDKAQLAAFVIANGAKLARSVVLEALSALTPNFISVDAFFQLIDTVGVRDESGHNSILPINDELVAALSSQADLRAFIEQIVARSGELRGSGEPGEELGFREAFAQTAAGVATKLLDFHPDNIPDVVTDLIMLLHEVHRFTDAEIALSNLKAAFATSLGRRRSSYWRATALARAHPWNQTKDDVNSWLLGFLGWPITLDTSDLDWLLADARHAAEQIDRLNALSAAFQIWRRSDGNRDTLERIRQAAAADQVLAAQLESWLSAPTENPAIGKQMANLEALEKRNRKRFEERDNSWVDLLQKLRDDPSIFDRLNPTTEETVDSRLYHLWQFLSWRVQNRSRYSIESLDVVEPIFGPELTRKFRAALVDFAYERAAIDRDDAGGADSRATTSFDIMALGGMSLAAATTPNWAQSLDAARAGEAARLAAIELNGFPSYLLPLADAHPEIVRAMLRKRAIGQLEVSNPEGHGMLDRLEYADSSLSALIADDLAAYLNDHPSIAPAMLEKLVSVLMRALPTDSSRLRVLSAARAQATPDPVTAAYYLLLLFAIEGDNAVEALRYRMASFNPADQATLCSVLLPRVLGGRYNRGALVQHTFAVTRLEQMLILAFEGIRVSEDINRPDGEVFSVGARDEAEDARNAIFNRILETPGEATQAVLRRLMTIPEFPIRPEWLRIHALRHAERDAELAPWLPGDVIVMERLHDRAPTTSADLLLLAQRRLEAIRHDIIDGKFAQGDTLQALPDEDAVQRWIADQLEARKKGAYSVQRETEVADANAPDIMLTSRHSGVDLPIEIKVVDGMTLADMEAALETQLCAQYLRHGGSRHGLLLLIHQHPRPVGWTLAAGEPLVSFNVVLERLEERARAIREASATGPQPSVFVIDVSKVIPLKSKRASTRQKTAAKKVATGSGVAPAG